MTGTDVYRELFNRVVQGRYRGGERLREDSLASEFQVSRTPVREALFQLARDGLAEGVPNRGFRAIGFTVDDLEEAYEIRRVLELLALERAVKTLPIVSLQEIARRIRALSADQDPLEYARIDSDLHALIVNSSQSRRLIAVLSSLYRIMQQFRELGFRDAEVRRNATEEHLRLIEALVSRDGNSAAGILDEHIRASKSRLLNLLLAGDHPLGGEAGSLASKRARNDDA